jgi:hypothetical protein
MFAKCTGKAAVGGSRWQRVGTPSCDAVSFSR